MSNRRTAIRGVALMIFSAWLAAAPALAAKSPRSVLSSFYVEAQDQLEYHQLLKGYDVESRSGTGMQVIIPADKAQEFLRVHPQAKLLEHDIHDIFTRKDQTNPGWDAGYHTWATIQSELNQLVQTYPTMLSLENYGASQNGEPLLALKMVGKNASAGKPEVLITSSTHGNEIATPELVMGAIEQLMQGYGSDSRMTQMVDNHVLYFIPVVCPDGYLQQDRYTNGLDPNRDYPYPTDPDHQSNASVANEMTWFMTKSIVGSLDIHSPAEMVMYPWAYTDSPIPSSDLPRFEKISGQMAQDLGFQSGQISVILYIAVGSSADYWYWKKNTLALGFEIGGGDFAPDASQLPAIIAQHLPAIWHFIENF